MNLIAFSFNYQTIGWILAGVVLLFILVGMGWGLIRGLQKTAFRCGWQVFFLIVFALLTPVIVGGLLKINIGFLNININGQKMTSIDGLILNAILSIDNSLTNSIASNPILIEFVSKLPYLILNSFVFVLLFWLSNLLFWPFWAIASHYIFKKQKLAKKAGQPVKKFRLLGGLLGIVFGFIFSAFTFMPVVGVLNTAHNLNGARASFITGEQTEEGIIDYYLQDNADYVLKLDSTPAFLMYRYTGLEFIDNFTFDGLSRAKVNGQQLRLKKELETTVNVLNAVGDIRVIVKDNLDQARVDKLISACRVLVDYMTQLQTFRILGNELMPDVANYIIDEHLIPSLDLVGANDLINSIVEEVGKTNVDKLKSEFNAVLDVIKTFNDKDLLVPLLNQQINAQDILEKIDAEFVDNFVDALYNSQIISSTTPKIINFSAKLILDALDGNLEDFEDQDLEGTNVKEKFKTVLKNMLEISDKVKQDPIPEDIADNVYNVVTGLNGLVTKKTFHAMLDAAANKIISNLQEQAYHGHVYNIIENIKKLTDEDVENEKELFKGVVNDILSFKDLDFENIDVETLDLDKIGKIFDTLSTSKILGSEIDPLIVTIIDQVEPNITSSITDVDLKTAVTDALAVVKQNIQTMPKTQSSQEPNAKGFYQNELSALKPVLTLKFDKNDLAAVGKVLDQVNTNSKLLTTPATTMQDKGSALHILLNAAIDLASNDIEDAIDDVTLRAAVIDALAVVKQNVNTLPATPGFYEKEFGALQPLINTTIDKNNLAAVGKLLDDVKDNSTLLTTVAQGMEQKGTALNIILGGIIDVANNTIAESIDDNTLKTALTEALSVVKENLTTLSQGPQDPATPGFYETELGTLQPLVDLNINVNDLPAVGKVLDQVKSTSRLFTTPAPSMVEKGTALHILLSAMFDTAVKDLNADQDLQSILTKIKGNLDNVDSYENEFNYISDITDNINIDTNQQIGTQGFTDVLVNYGKLLDKLVNSQLLVNGEQDIRRDIFVYGIDKLKASQSDPDLLKIFNSARDNAQYIETNKSSPVYENIFKDLDEVLTKTNDLTKGTDLTPGTDNFTTTLTDLGKMLDDLRTNQLFVNTTQGHEHDVRQDILKLALDKASTNIVKDNETITSMLDEIKQNITKLPIDHTSLVYEHELTSLATLINTLNTIDYTAISDGLTSLATLTNKLKSGEGDTPKSVLCEDSGYYILKMFSSIISDVQTLKDNVSSEDLTKIKKCVDDNVESLKANYNTAEHYDYSTAITGLVEVNTKISNLGEIIKTIEEDITKIDVNAFADIFNTMQETIILDYSVTQTVAVAVLEKMKTFVDNSVEKNIIPLAKPEQQGLLRLFIASYVQKIKDQIQREKLTVAAQTGDYLADNYLPSFNGQTGDKLDYNRDGDTGEITWTRTASGGYGHYDEDTKESSGSIGRIKSEIEKEFAEATKSLS